MGQVQIIVTIVIKHLTSHALTQETQAGQNEQLAMLKPDDFSSGIAIMSQDGNEYKLKYSELLYTRHAAC